MESTEQLVVELHEMQKRNEAKPKPSERCDGDDEEEESDGYLLF